VPSHRISETMLRHMKAIVADAEAHRESPEHERRYTA
jgi:hypothetical protein